MLHSRRVASEWGCARRWTRCTWAWSSWCRFRFWRDTRWARLQTYRQMAPQWKVRSSTPRSSWTRVSQTQTRTACCPASVEWETLKLVLFSRTLIWDEMKNTCKHVAWSTNICTDGPSLPPAYVVRREGNVLTRVCPSICLSTGGGVPISHNALQHFPECHGAGTGGVPCQVQLGGGYPARGVPCQGGTLPGGYPAGGYPAGGVPCWGGTLAGGTLPGGVPS